MQYLSSHYQQLLGLPSPWKVDHVDLSIPNKQVTIKLLYAAKRVKCPACGESPYVEPESMTDKQRASFDELMICELKTGTA